MLKLKKEHNVFGG